MAVTGTNTENQRMKIVAEEVEVKTALTVNGQPVDGSTPDASAIPFSSANFTATDVAAALEELFAALPSVE